MDVCHGIFWDILEQLFFRKPQVFRRRNSFDYQTFFSTESSDFMSNINSKDQFLVVKKNECMLNHQV